ncbi:carbohydrate kinase family protein [Flavobacterium gelatinilyticum]|uniref:carbohydrate kinase family protein n=1 Tax=Flavobacterium gelatinilyticum TaxID=3003260 RepID=UPI0024807A6C|nr:carbohydrate kinase [Flavobacterium gelatinilyticum]
MKEEIKNSVYCYGEVLWDIFPEGARAGGAPFNVAYNLMRMGIDSHMISRVGNDKLGDDLMAQLKNWNIPIDDSQIDLEYSTGTVIAHIDEHNEAHYDILKPVAWDYIHPREDYPKKVSEASAFVFGSLITRNETSRNTLFQLLESAQLKVFDVNLRPPHYSIPIINDLLKKADIVKMNKAELKLILEFLGKSYIDEDDAVHYVQDQFDVKEVLISKGSKGALYYNGNAKFEAPAVSITVEDTVGSGDSFLAGFLSKRIIGAADVEILNQAVALGAFITSKKGACPDYTLSEFELFRKENQK